MIWSIISSLLVLIPSTFLLVFFVKLLNWIYLTIFLPKDIDLSAYGGSKIVEEPMRNPKAWALITGASDGIGAAFAKVKHHFKLEKPLKNLLIKYRSLLEKGSICFYSEEILRN